jgi:phosphoribosyl-AMP cyclohydrolase
MTKAEQPSLQLPATIRRALRFDDRGLVPAIIRSNDDGEILMLAWMNEEALAETLDSGALCYWSRSRSRLWRKGERSGQRQRLVRLRLDCDGDTLLIDVEQTGVACHTGRRSCFYRELDGGTKELKIVEKILTDPKTLYESK